MAATLTPTASEARAATPAEAPDSSTGNGPASLLIELWVILLSGIIPTGGKPNVIWNAELIQRRGWMNAADMAESLAIGKLLPGLTSVNMLIFLAPCMRRPVSPLLALLPFMIPGCVVMLGISMLMLGSDRPGWVNALLQGMSAGAVGMLLSTLSPLLPVGRKARGGWLFIGLAFAAVGLLRLDLLLVLVGLGGVSLLLNWPWRGADR